MKDAIASTIGGFLDSEAQRDAIHMAIVPVVASCSLEAGQHIGIMDNGRASSGPKKLIGIVDPFLTQTVRRGDRFWLFLYPGTVKGMRHDFDVPGLPAEEPEPPEPQVEEDPDDWCKTSC